MHSSARKSISWIGIVFGLFLGIAYVLLVAPIFLFTIGKNDSWIEISATLTLLVSTLPATVFALSSRKRAGIWLTVVAMAAGVATAWNTSVVLNAGGIKGSFGEILGSALFETLAVLLGIFFWVTGSLGWPELKAGGPGKHSE